MGKRSILAVIVPSIWLFGCPDSGSGGGGEVKADSSVGNIGDAETLVPTPDNGVLGFDAEVPDTDAAPLEPCDVENTRACPDPACAAGTQRCENGFWTPCEGPAETCNQVDDDCDGTTDEGYDGLGTDCTVGFGACEGTGKVVCAPDGASTVCAAVAGTPTAEVCDGADNDCDGEVDVDPATGLPLASICYAGPPGTEGVGACRPGADVCVDGLLAGCQGEVLPTDEVCDGIDNDCDGAVDDAANGGDIASPCYSGAAETLNVGLCRGGLSTCAAGELGACAGEVVPAVEFCDGLDNDCDGQIDDVEGGCACEPGNEQGCYNGPAGTEGIGICRAGRQFCNADGSGYGACEGVVLPTAELCNGLDDDCNGRVDDGIVGVGAECDAGIGACGREGLTICDSANGFVICSAVAGEPSPEVCDLIDNDCDGRIDDGLGLLQPCSAGQGACQRPGVTVCGANGAVVCGAQPGLPEVDLCDGADNDCDGQSDEGLDLGAACVSGEGACARDGVLACGPNGQVVCNGQAGQPGEERCNGIDDNCNGQVDERAVDAGLDCDTGRLGVCASGTSACVDGGLICLADAQAEAEACDGVDNDCNGLVDDDDGAELRQPCYDGPPGTAGVGPCAQGFSVCVEGEFGACRDQVVPGVELCDTLDNDCNGRVDDPAVGSCVCQPREVRACYTGPAGTADVGICRSGQQICSDDGAGFGPCVREITPDTESCDGRDNDCNGVADDAIEGVGAPCTDGVGRCLARGVTFCDAARGLISCGAQAGQPRDEVCDGIDDDCDASLDEGLGLNLACSVGVGACRAEGVQVCGQGGGVVCGAQPGRPVAEVCDGQDNDCDGTVDDGLRVGERCQVGVGACLAAGVFVCAADGGVTCSAQAGNPVAEVCDGVDNNCDGAVDENNPGGGDACDSGLRGACAVGARVCQGGALVCVARNRPQPEVCDGVDNDCDGLDDENANGQPLTQACYEGPAGTQNVGLCAGGNRTCDAGLFGACVGQILPAAEICDTLDNDCSGRADDLPNGAACVCRPGEQRACYSGAAGTQNVGICRGGTQTCLRDGSSFGPCVGEQLPVAEVCDTLDNDCNRLVDDAPGAGQRCVAGDGACQRVGQLVCGPRGELACNVVAGQPSVEVCDNVDNDCDGITDDVATLGDRCTSGVGECRQAGNLVCDFNRQTVVCGAVPLAPRPEVCDGLDNNCNGQPDDGQLADVGEACSNGIGACTTQGQTACVRGQELCNAGPPGQPGPETCDGIDGDCDGRVDERPTADENQACNVGVGQCVRRGVTVCGGEGLSCVGQAGDPLPERCNEVDDDCNGQADDGAGLCDVFVSCKVAYDRGFRRSGIYRLQPPGTRIPVEVHCDMATDGGGWTLVGSTRTVPLADQASGPYADLATLAPAGQNRGVWSGLRPVSDRFDLRFTCRRAPAAAPAAMTVDLSVYDTGWYTEFTTGADGESCFEELNGQGDTQPAAARRNNLSGAALPLGDDWNFGYFEGEDDCGSTDDFAMDFDDRGMDNNQRDGTDWGEDDNSRKCGVDGLADGQWFLYAREIEIEQPIECAANVGVLGGFFYHDELVQYLNTIPGITAERFDTCDIETLNRFDLIVLQGNGSCFDGPTFDAYVASGRGIIGTPWVVNNVGSTESLPVAGPSLTTQFSALKRLDIVEPNSPLIQGVNLAEGDGVCPAGQPIPIGNDPDCVGFEAPSVLREGATLVARHTDYPGSIALADWTYGEGRGVYLGFHYLTSDTNSAIAYAWGQDLMKNAVFLAAGCLNQGGDFPPQVGQQGQDGVAEGDPWIVCRADVNSAWVAANDGGTYDAVAACQALGYVGVDAWGGTCGTVCGYCGEAGNETYDGAGGNSPESLSQTVHWRCTGEIVVEQPVFVGSFLVNEGPQWFDPGVVTYSCREACALNFGGDQASYRCSTIDGEVNGRAFADGWGDTQYCQGDGVADDFSLPPQGLYDCGEGGCSYSAFVSDHGCASRNYCWTVDPIFAPQ